MTEEEMTDPADSKPTVRELDPQTSDGIPAANAPAMSASPTGGSATHDHATNEVYPKLAQSRLRSLSRRSLLGLVPLAAAGAFAVKKWQQPLLDRGLAFSDTVAGDFFSRHRLARTFRDSEVALLEKFPYNYYEVLDPEVDLSTWTFDVSGAMQRPGSYTMDQIKALPKIVQNTRHVCVEGWAVIGNFGGTRVSDFLKLIGADLKARFVEVDCADDYYESIDMASILHPQSLLCYEMYGQPLNPGHGAPLRLQMPTKLGYKQAKYLTGLRVTNVLTARKGYWEDLGYSWFGGL